MSKLINVISGKGGTGKTLLTVVLADILSMQSAKVLVVDMDIFVCGVTTMFFYENQEAMQLIPAGTHSVSDFYLERNNYRNPVTIRLKPAILTYPGRSFKIFPSLDRIDRQYPDKSDLLPNDAEDADHLFRFLMQSIPTNEYDYILFDNRAGYDPLVAAAHKHCDFSLCVEEDDDISLITSERLIYLLDQEKPVHRIRNKVRTTGSGQTLKMGLHFLGAIGFEFEVFNNFGTVQFWSKMARTEYRTAVCRVWNELAKKESLKHQIALSSAKTRTVRRLMPVLDKSFALVGFLMTLVGILAQFMLLFTEKPFDPIQFYSILLTITLGLTMMILSSVDIHSLRNSRRKK